MSDANTYLQKLLVTHPLRDALLRSIIRALRLPSGSRGLDAGCGIGQPAALLAEAVGPSGHVTGVDIAPEFISYANRVAEESSLSERMSFRQGNVNSLPFDDSSFDWVWSADCVGYGPGDALSLIKELARVVKPGGTVAILMYSSQQLLPGYPRLEARLNATSSGIAPFTESMRPERHYYRALGWFRDAGLTESRAQTFVESVCAPLSDETRNALIALLDMRWSNLQAELSPEDLKEYKRLSHSESPDFILDCPDYYAFFTYSLFHGKVPG
jgi:ubiquinone/menaquinone biosynthesis C-methylase UbiE